jgi:transposase
MGRSRGRLTTKIHALVDALGLPIAIKLTPAVQCLPSSLPQPRRTLLQQTQALPGRRHPLRKGQRKRPRSRQTRFSQNLDALYEPVS